MIRPTPRQAAEELGRRSLCDFGRLAMPSLDLSPFHLSYYRALDLFARGRIRRLIVSVPPQHGKSLGSSVLLPAYLLGRRTDCRIALASYNLRLASRFCRQVQRLMDDPVYKRIFPQTRLKQSPAERGVLRTSDEFELTGAAGGLLCAGREGTLTGRPVDVLILDDLYKNMQEACSPLIRDNTWDWYNAVARTRLHNDSQELIVFTRWHEDDLVGRIAAQEPVAELTDFPPEGVPPGGPWLRLDFEAVKRSPPTAIDPRPEGEPLWPRRHSAELLESKRRLDPLLFETMYQGRPSPPEGLLYGDRFSTYGELPADTLKKGNYTDTADAGGDRLCSVCYETGRDGTIYVTDVLYTPMGMEATEPLVAEMLRRNGTRTARVESNNGGRGFARAVGRLCPEVRIEWFHQSQNKEARVLSNATTVLARIAMPTGWGARWSAFHADLVTFRRRFRSNRHDDAPDVLTGLVETETDPAARHTIRAVGFSR